MLAFIEKLTDKQVFQAWAICSTIIFIAYYRWPSRRLDHIPAVGPKSQILSFIGAFEFLLNAPGVIQRGCEKYRNSVFRVPNFDRWMVIVHRPEYVEEIRNTAETTLSFMDAVDESLQMSWTLGPTIKTDPYHVPLVRTLLTRNLNELFPTLHNEVVDAFNEVIPQGHGGEWAKLNALKTMMPVICRASNCIFVGAPLCRDPDYMELNIKFTLTVTQSAVILQHTPPFLRRFVAAICTNLSSDIKRGVKHLKPLIEERRRQIEEFGKDYPDKPNDFLSWLMDEAKGDEATIEGLSRRILTLNFAAIHTSSMTFCHALYYLAAHPEHQEVIREEVQEVIHREGWTFAAMSKLYKVDSFIKETQRLKSIGCVTMSRIVRQPFTFSDGTYLPPGTLLGVASHAIHIDEENYSDPLSFEPFRYVDKAKKENAGRRAEMTATNTAFLPFGHGRHACPGRFFAANELKLMLAHLVMNYDMKLDGPRPQDLWVVTACVPNPKGEVLFRRRLPQD